MVQFEAFQAVQPAQLSILALLEDAQTPMGARHSTEYLRANGVKCSEATVSRWLNNLDKLGYTEPVGKKGRVITQLGRQVLSQSRFNAQSGRSFSETALVQNAHQLIDLLHLRRGIESEAAFLAAQRATADDILRLAENVDSYLAHADTYEEREVIGQDFHQLVMAAAHSQSLSSINDIVLKPGIEALAPVLEIITSGHGTTGTAPKEHEAIFEAIKNKNPHLARETTEAHLDRFAKEVDEFVGANRSDVLNRLLASKFSHHSPGQAPLP